MGEFGLIDRIALITGAFPDALIKGIGDDAAVIRESAGDCLLATVDMLVEGVHFSSAAPPEPLGQRALAVNISDIAAMGGLPHTALVSLALPPETPVGWVQSLYQGLTAEALDFEIALAGGNLTRTTGARCIDVVLLGHVARTELVLRSGARVGDVLAVTGTLGSAASELLPTARVDLAGRSLPVPRVEVGRALARQGLAHAMIDLSDGLAGDLAHLCKSSGVGAVVRAERVPVSPIAAKRAKAAGIDPLSLALQGGEDYELLFAAATEDWQAVVYACGDTPVRQIGTVLDAQNGIMLEERNGRRRPLNASSWTHF